MMPGRNSRVIPFRRATPISADNRLVADVAFNLWLARGFKGGSPIWDLLSAIREVKGTSAARLFVVPKRRPVRSDVGPPAA